jgi:hypothetical protein
MGLNESNDLGQSRETHRKDFKLDFNSIRMSGEPRRAYERIFDDALTHYLGARGGAHDAVVSESNASDSTVLLQDPVYRATTTEAIADACNQCIADLEQRRDHGQLNYERWNEEVGTSSHSSVEWMIKVNLAAQFIFDNCPSSPELQSLKESIHRLNDIAATNVTLLGDARRFDYIGDLRSRLIEAHVFIPWLTDLFSCSGSASEGECDPKSSHVTEADREKIWRKFYDVLEECIGIPREKIRGLLDEECWFQVGKTGCDPLGPFPTWYTLGEAFGLETCDEKLLELRTLRRMGNYIQAQLLQGIGRL